MRFADLDGSMIDVYQAMTQVTDETSTMSLPRQVDTLLDNALGPKAYYGVYTVLTHTDHGDHANANDVVAAAQERGVPVVSSAQMLDWVDGRNGSSFDDISYSGGQLSFSMVTNAEGARPRGDAPGPVGLRPALPADARRPAGGPQQAHRQGRATTWSSRRRPATTRPRTPTTRPRPRSRA